MGFFSARTASGEQGSGGDVVSRKLGFDGSGGQMRGKLIAGGCMTTSSYGLCLLFENFFERLGIEDAFRPAV